MKKSKASRLTLSKETLKTLRAAQLDKAAGGFVSDFCDTNFCVSNVCPTAGGCAVRSAIVCNITGFPGVC